MSFFQEVDKMNDAIKTKKQLIGELAELRQRVSDIESLGVDSKQVGNEVMQIKIPSSLLENLTDVIIIIEIDGIISLVSPSIERVLEYKPEELINRNISDILHPDDLTKVISIYNQATKNQHRIKSVEYQEYRLKHKDGSWRIFEMNLIDNSNIEGFVLIYRDITESKQAKGKIEKAVQEWITTFDSITDMVSIQDRDFKIVRVNRSLANVLGTTPQKLIGKTCYKVIHKTKEPPSNCPHRKTLISKEPTRVEFFEPSLSIDIEVSTSPIFNEEGEVVSSVHIIRDITESKRVKEEINERNNALEQKVREITALNVLFQDHLNMRFQTEESFKKLIESIQDLSFEANQLLEVKGNKVSGL